MKTWKTLLLSLVGLGMSFGVLAGGGLLSSNSSAATEVKAADYSETFSYGLNGWSLTNYTDQSGYYLVPSDSGPSVATFPGVFQGKTITSDVVVTINCATYGSGTNPSADTFSIYKETDCKNKVTATQGGTLPTSKAYTDVTYTVTQANAASLGDDLAIKITKPGKMIRLKSVKIDFDYQVAADAPKLTSLVISGDPTKTKYIAGDIFDPAGLTVTGTYNDSSQKTITSGITWSEPEALKAGQTSVSITATVSGITSPSYVVSGLTVEDPVLTSIEVSGSPKKTTYNDGDTLNPEGLTVVYKDQFGSTIDLPQDKTLEWMLNPETLSAGDTTCEVMACVGDAVSDAYIVSGLTVKAILNSIKLEGDVKTIYKAGETVSKEGLVVKASYQNKETEIDVTSMATITANVDTVSSNTEQIVYTATFEGETATKTVDITIAALNAVEVKTSPTKTTYHVGDKFDPTGLVITKKFTNGGSDEDVAYANDSSNFTFVPALNEGITADLKAVTVTYAGKSVDISIAIDLSVDGELDFGTNRHVSAVNVSDVADSTGVVKWSVVTSGTTSFTNQRSYAQFGSSSKPATSITATATIPEGSVIKTIEGKFGGFSDTKGSIDLSVSGTSVATGDLNGNLDVVVKNDDISATGREISLYITDIDKGVKIYYLKYSYLSVVEEHNIDYRVGNGTLADGAQTETKNGSVTLPNVNANEGYLFQGWATKENGDVVYQAGERITDVKEDLTFFAVVVKKIRLGTPVLVYDNENQRISWTKVANADSYEVTVSSRDDKGEEVKETSSTSETVYSVAALGNGSYRITVVAKSNNPLYADSEPGVTSVVISSSTEEKLSSLNISSRFSFSYENALSYDMNDLPDGFEYKVDQNVISGKNYLRSTAKMTNSAYDWLVSPEAADNVYVASKKDSEGNPTGDYCLSLGTAKVAGKVTIDLTKIARKPKTIKFDAQYFGSDVDATISVGDTVIESLNEDMTTYTVDIASDATKLVISTGDSKSRVFIDNFVFGEKAFGGAQVSFAVRIPESVRDGIKEIQSVSVVLSVNLGDEGIRKLTMTGDASNVQKDASGYYYFVGILKNIPAEFYGAEITPTATLTAVLDDDAKATTISFTGKSYSVNSIVQEYMSNEKIWASLSSEQQALLTEFAQWAGIKVGE